MMEYYFCLGSYTEAILFGTGEIFYGQGKGISICRFCNGEISIISEIAAQNPSYICFNEDKNKIYSVNELKEFNNEFGGGITQFSYSSNGNITKEGTFNSKGTDPCHIEISQNRKFLSISNFASGSVCIFFLSDEGNILNKSKFFKHKGKSIIPVRQDAAHAHSTIFAPNNRTMYVPDLGSDTLICYNYVDSEVEIDLENTIKIKAGMGPRYGEFDKEGKNLYIINELGSSISHFRVYNDKLVIMKIYSTLPEKHNITNTCSDLHLTNDGRYLYASNRGHDSIACFKVNEDGTLECIDICHCGGKTPRNFAISPDDEYVLIGNQDSNYISVMKRIENGFLSWKCDFYTGSPVCIRFFEHTAFDSK